MILQYGSEGFKESWLENNKNDPVHPTILLQKRITGNRKFFAYTDDLCEPQFII